MTINGTIAGLRNGAKWRMVIDMEKFQIVKYGLMQVAAIVYGVMVCGAGVRSNRDLAERGIPMSNLYYAAHFFRDYGFLFLGVVVLWVAAASYFSSPFAPRQFDEDHLAYSGLILVILIAVAASILAFGTIHNVVGYSMEER